MNWWLSRTEPEEKLSEEDDWEGKNEREERPVYKEPEFIESENTRIKANMLSKARKQLYEDEGSQLSGSLLVTSRPKKISKQSMSPCVVPAPVFPSVDIREDMVPAPDYLAPSIPRQEIEVGQVISCIVLLIIYFNSWTPMGSSSSCCPYLSVQVRCTFTPYKSPVGAWPSWRGS